jgi:predicted membrane-bound mannosyltransferase
MAASGNETEEWRLGIEPGVHGAPATPEEAAAPRNRSAERLERPLCVLTAEHVGWATVGVLALASRFVTLGARPLDTAEASHALSELALLRSGPPAGAHLSWIHLLQAAVFAAVGAGDFKARVIFALSGLLLIASSLGMRRQLGRAGAMAFAGLLVLSPSVAYFSRTTDSVAPALAFAVLALAMFLELAVEPGRIIAAGLGAAIGLGLATGGSALMTALFMFAALAIVGLLAALAGTRVRLQVRVWWTRRKSLFLITTLVAAVVWLGCESGFFTRSPLGAIVAAFRSNLPSNLLHADPADHRGFMAGLDFYLPILSLYEFFVVLLALIGALSVLTLRVRSRLATAALVWSALAIAFYLWTPARSPALVLEMIVPMALLGAFAIDSLHHTVAWSILRYPLAVLALLTLSVQVANNFIWYAPDASEAPWARTALLFWTEPATTLQTPVECARVTGQLPPHKASAFFASDSPVLRWYLRALAPAATAEGADAIVGSAEPASVSQAQGFTTYEFELDDSWHPSWWSLSPHAAMHYLASAHPWTPLESHRVTIAARPVVTLAPTVILAPVATPPAAGPAASAGSAGSEGQSVPEASASEASASPAPSASATPAFGTGPESHSSAALASTPAATPTATIAATATAAPTATASPSETPAATPVATPSAVSARKPAATASRSPINKPDRIHLRHNSAGSAN